MKFEYIISKILTNNEISELKKLREEKYTGRKEKHMKKKEIIEQLIHITEKIHQNNDRLGVLENDTKKFNIPIVDKDGNYSYG